MSRKASIVKDYFTNVKRGVLEDLYNDYYAAPRRIIGVEKYTDEGSEGVERFFKQAPIAKQVGEAAPIIPRTLTKIARNPIARRVTDAVPIVGDVAEFGLRVGTGQEWDDAAVQTIGGSLGGTIGAVAGATLTPFAPFLGGAIGAMIGSSLGDFAAGKLWNTVTRDDSWGYKDKSEVESRKSKELEEELRRQRLLRQRYYDNLSGGYLDESSRYYF